MPPGRVEPRLSGGAHTIIDAPPPTVARPLHEPSPDRLAAERERRARKRRRGWLALLLVLMLSASAALAGWYLTEGRFTTAPDLASLSRTEAQRVARNSGLMIDFSDAYSETVARGQVISTDPGPGTKIEKGSRIKAALSQGPERYSMPAVVGLSQSAAEAAIQKAKLVVGKIANGFSEHVAAGVVLSASEKEGARLRRGTAVDLVVSNGPKPLVITNYEGTPYDPAAAALSNAGFRVVQRSAYSNKVAKDLVLRQNPRSGHGAPGDTVTLTRSLGQNLITVPNVQRMAVPAARKVMRQAGFKTKVQPVSINRPGVSYVVYTNPAARTEAPKGSTITLYVV
jgi:beta-lactam-binding protein with PASTA domain